MQYNVEHFVPYCRELMVPQSCPPPTALALRWCSGHARCQWYVLLHSYDFPSCTLTAPSAVWYWSGRFDNSAIFLSLYFLRHTQSQSGTNSRRAWVSVWWCAVIRKFIPHIATLPLAGSFRLFIPYITSYGIVIRLRAAQPWFEKFNCFGIKSKYMLQGTANVGRWRLEYMFCSPWVHLFYLCFCNSGLQCLQMQLGLDGSPNINAFVSFTIICRVSASRWFMFHQ